MEEKNLETSCKKLSFHKSTSNNFSLFFIIFKFIIFYHFLTQYHIFFFTFSSSNSQRSHRIDPVVDHDPSNYVINIMKDDVDNFKVPHSSKNYRNRSRRNSQTSIGMSRESSEDRTYPGGRRSGNRNRKNSYNSGYIGSRDNSTDRRDNNYMPRSNRSRRNSGRFSSSRDNSGDRGFWSGRKDVTNWRAEMPDRNENVDQNQPGILKLPQQPKNTTTNFDDGGEKEYMSLPNFPPPFANADTVGGTKTLFDPKNPNKPIVVSNKSQRRVLKTSDADSGPCGVDNVATLSSGPHSVRSVISEQYHHVTPPWYDKKSAVYQTLHVPEMVEDLQKADWEIQLIIENKSLFHVSFILLIL